MSAPPKPARRDAAATRRRILDSALGEFSAHGHGGARIDRIARAAGVSKPMIYSYFGDKEELYKAALRESYVQIRQGEREIDTDHMPPEQAIRELVRFTMEHFVSKPWFTSMLNTENMRGGVAVREIEDLGAIQSPLIAQIRAILERGVAEGAFRPGIDPTELYITMASLCFFPVSNRHTLRVVFNVPIDAAWLRRRTEEAGEMIIRYLRVAPDGGTMIALSLCNELLADEGLSLDRQCEVAAALGYMGLELALGSLVARPHEMSDAQALEMRRTVERHGLAVTGLHWLLAPYPELSVTDPLKVDETRAVLTRLVTLCALLGGRVLVHGSPAQRAPMPGEDAATTMARLAETFAPVAQSARSAGVTYCIEPLSPTETPVINTVADGAALVEAIGSPAFRTMIDTSAAGQSETVPVADALAHWLPGGAVAHVHVNDTNRGAPGMGRDPFHHIVRALRDADWPHPVAVEPFRTCIDATTTAAIGAATLRAAWQAAR